MNYEHHSCGVHLLGYFVSDEMHLNEANLFALAWLELMNLVDNAYVLGYTSSH